MSILHFLLHNDATGLKDCFVPGNSMSELLVKNLEDLDACVKGVTLRFSPSVQSSDYRAVIGRGNGY
jgi:hypothetical protein